MESLQDCYKLQDIDVVLFSFGGHYVKKARLPLMSPNLPYTRLKTLKLGVIWTHRYALAQSRPVVRTSKIACH